MSNEQILSGLVWHGGAWHGAVGHGVAFLIPL